MTKSCIFGALLSALVLVGCDRDVHVDNRSQGEGGGGSGATAKAYLGNKSSVGPN